MSSTGRSLFQIHIAVLLFGASGLFAKLLDLPALVITFGRLFFSCIFLGAMLFFLGRSFALEGKKSYFTMLILGFILAIHWYSFFLGIQLSTVAIGLLSFSSFTIFVTFLEPLFDRERIRVSSIVTALIAFGGIALIVPEFRLGNEMTQGLLWGLFSGFSYAILSILNRKTVARYPGALVAFYEQTWALLLLAPFMLFQPMELSMRDLELLALLGIVFTGVGHTLFIGGLKKVKTQTAAIITCAEPVYSILLAIFLLGEIPTLKVLLGGFLILGTVVWSTWHVKD